MKPKFFILPALVVSIWSFSCSQLTPVKESPKNIIILIGDGMGFNHVDATSLFVYGATGKLAFEGKEWLRVAQATYPAVIDINSPDGYATGYNPRNAWSDTAYLKKDYTDSGAAGTALSTGFKTYLGAIGIGIEGDTLRHISELAMDLGKAAGVISSVQISHATPAGFSAHNEYRNNYEQIAQQQILKTKLKVLMGCGHPEFDDDGEQTESTYKYVGGAELWKQIKHNSSVINFKINDKEYTVADIDHDAKPDAWTLITDSVDFAALARGENIPERLLGIPKVHSTLQQGRKNKEEQMPWKQPMNVGLPNLEQMTLAALHVLNQEPDGFFLMVEGGAIDWAAHSNQSGRMIEEVCDFNKAVDAVVKWIEKYSSWAETLVIVTADHETGMLWGPDSDKKVLTEVKSRGKGELPEMQWYSKEHTNSLVPLYAKGKGSNLLELLADEFDPVRGRFVQNTEISKCVFLLWEH